MAPFTSVFWVCTLSAAAAPSPTRTERTVTSDSMVRVVFTGDSQSCGRNLAVDFPQLISRAAPVRVINTAVGGSNSDALLKPMDADRVRITRGEHVLYGEGVRWGMGPFPGMRVTVHGNTYTIASIDEHPGGRAELLLVEPARETYEGADCRVEPGWRVRVQEQRPDVVCLMFINDGAMPAPRLANWREMLRRIRALGATAILMSPVPVDDRAHGGSHPGDNRSAARNAEAVRRLAVEEKCWFLDVFGLTLALDPPLRTVIRDGIHPDTDGSTVIVNGLLRIFGELGLLEARPYVRGHVLTGAVARLPRLLAGGARPFTISQPDHPDPDHQDTRGFSLEARIRNDEYGLIAKEDGHSLPLDHGVLLEWGLPQGTSPREVRLGLRFTGGDAPEPTAVLFWRRDRGEWIAGAGEKPLGNSLDLALPPGTVQDGVFTCLVPAVPGLGLDAAEVRGAAPPRGGRPGPPASVAPHEVTVESDHASPANLAPNPAFTEGSHGMATGWAMTEPAWVNRPFRHSGLTLGFDREDRLNSCRFRAPPGVQVRPFDLLMVSGSNRGNDGPYRVRDVIEGDRLLLRRKAAAAECGLVAELVHDDGCGLVPGGCCVQLPAGGKVVADLALPAAIPRLRVSLFFRVVNPKASGTRDRPRTTAEAVAVFPGGAGAQPQTVRLAAPRGSFQWQKLEADLRLPTDVRSLRLELHGAGPEPVQYTGIYVGRTP